MVWDGVSVDIGPVNVLLFVLDPQSGSVSVSVTVSVMEEDEEFRRV